MNIYEENIVWKRRPFNLTKMFGNWKDNVQLGELKESMFLLLRQGHLLRVKCRNRLSGKRSWWKWNLKSRQRYFMFFFEEGNDLLVIWFMIPLQAIKVGYHSLRYKSLLEKSFYCLSYWLGTNLHLFTDKFAGSFKKALVERLF